MQWEPVRGSAEPARSDCEGLCWNLAARRLGGQPHAGPYSAGQFSSSFGSFTQPCTQWLHKADYKLQRIPEGAKSDAGANEPREPLIPVTEWDKLGKAWTTQIQAHQAAESLPWEPGVIIRPIQRGPGTLGAREAGPRGSASARPRPWGPRGACGGAGVPARDVCVRTVSVCEIRAQKGPGSTPLGTQEATGCVDVAPPLFIQRPDRTALSPPPPWRRGSLCAPFLPQPAFPIGPGSDGGRWEGRCPRAQSRDRGSPERRTEDAFAARPTPAGRRAGPPRE
ncbi:collagen alpha-1(I) chain-like [Sus scrofa]|uniref:Collagen alpha-1(I) chain-like n=2 Tax=Sus scrofa TaxID=9823 RepID=A0A4X1U599_PIG|nr:collagen alpha-1(I) chain-like [Sus scrofa]XP_020921596.1 collagen alpha-1(I) chain-like [Sus scrofa]